MKRLLLVFVLLFNYALQAQVEYKYSYVPKKVYETQVFPVTIIGIGARSDTAVEFIFDTASDIVPLSDKPLIVSNGNDSFYTFYFKAENSNIRLPALSISSSTSSTRLEHQNIMIENLDKREDFSGVLATNFTIKNSQLSNYDENNSMIILSIEAFEANIEEMKIQGAIESGIESLSREFAKVTAELYIVIPSDKKEIEFTYFNTIKKQYILLKISTILKDTSVATQSDLNPKEDNFEKLKKYAMMILSIFFTLMFLFKRDFLYLILAAISIISLLTLFIPHEKVCVSQGTALYLLPTATSTISTYIDKELKTSLLATREAYSKIAYKKSIIGWIKNENICNH